MVSVRVAAAIAIVASSAAVFFACGPSASNVPILREAGDPCPVGGCVDSSIDLGDGSIVITPDPLEDWDGGDAGGPLSGIFAVEATVTARAGVEVTSKQLYRLRILQEGNWIHEKTTLCALELPSVPNVVTLIVPPALQTLIESRSTEDEGDYLQTSDPTNLANATYAPPPFVQVFGANLANPTTDPLPTMDAGATATDDDNDGHPGVTLVATAVTCTQSEELYVALRAEGELTGKVQTLDTITGYGQITLNESVLGYSDPCLAVASQIQIQVEPNSPFTATRVDNNPAYDIDHNGNVSCPEIVLSAPQIFPDFNQ